MNFFSDIFSNNILWVSVLACFLAQFLKIFSGDKRVEISRIIISGGMPSSHSSFVSCMSTMIGLKYGFSSDIFAIAAVVSTIIMYDASGVRQAVGKQATILNQLIEDWQNNKEIKQEKLKELMGHTPKQVFFGAILGILIGLIF
ncbi:acid phosphatase [Peptostreptococcus sp. MV1]|uniref:divergent PAP2 family protein n=1 Tax=Peptostreptococcus sp. MV1 TaxID=1219626 RepID=UPI00050F5CE3|nr:divergent PAP2 family protein [Peptostreptococcus sp. MV1]KGF12247.1 acid phosphatase [Peptostreptococcus sp. MV1]